jgi:hypothetical protein
LRFVPQHRRGTWLVIATLIATFCFAAPAATVFAGTGDYLCTQQKDPLHPPEYIRVHRVSKGHSGEVDTVPFWSYVGTVVRGEYGTGVRRSPHWLRVGAIIVKQYAWYYVVKWRGGHNAAGQCYHVKDTTADQMYKPELYQPNETNLSAMRDTWHMVLRKWVPTKNQSTIFLSGYRTGTKVACGKDAIGHRIYQKSLRDCENKNLVLEEMLRKYFEPNLQIVDTRGHDAVVDGGFFNGDLVTLSANSGAAAWRTYAGGNGSFANGAAGGIDLGVSLLGQGVGNIDTTRNNTNEALADLLTLVNTGAARELRIYRATGDGFSSTPDTKVVAPATSRLLVADFNGDQRVDAGLLSQNGTQATLNVMLLNEFKAPDVPVVLFGTPSEWWSGELDLDATVQMADDTDGDGKADLVVRRTDGELAIAHSDPSCSTYSAWGPCPTESIASKHLGALEPTGQSADTAAHLTLTDFNRDGRSDVITATKSGGNVQVSGLRGLGDGKLADPHPLWLGAAPFAFESMNVVGMNVNSDSLGDVVIAPDLTAPNAKPVWLRSVEQSKTSQATMTLVQAGDDLSWTPAEEAF